MSKKQYASKAKTETFTKKTGAKFQYDKKGRPIVVAWKAGRYGLLSILVSPCKHTSEVESPKSGRIWLCGCSVSITNKTTGAKSFHFGMMEKATGRVIIKDLGWIINPKAPNGGVVAKIGGR